LETLGEIGVSETVVSLAAKISGRKGPVVSHQPFFPVRKLDEFAFYTV